MCSSRFRWMTRSSIPWCPVRFSIGSWWRCAWQTWYLTISLISRGNRQLTWYYFILIWLTMLLLRISMVKDRRFYQKFSAILFQTRNFELKGKFNSNPQNPLISRPPTLRYQMARIKLRKRKRKRGLRLMLVMEVIFIRGKLHLKHPSKIITRAHSAKSAHLASYPTEASTIRQ